jgi:hypothetical protein
MSFATLLASTPAGVYIGAFWRCYLCHFLPDLNRFKQIMTFFISFLLGFGQSGHRHSFPALGQYLPDGVIVEPWLVRP